MSETSPASSGETAPAWGVIALFAAAKLAVQLVALGGYGYFRDELYYLSCTDHLAWGYVDHPPFSVAALWLATSLFGEGLGVLRGFSAVLGAGLVAIVGWTAARLGGGRGAQALAMTAALVAPVYLSLHHFYSMNAWSLFFWALAQAILVHLLAGADRRWWPVLGVVLGLGLLNKVDVLWLGAGLGAGLLIAGRERLRTLGPWLAGALSMLLFAPHLVWQAIHGWPTLEFVSRAGSEKMKVTPPLDYLAEQVMMMHPLTLPLWLSGLVFLLVLPAGRRFRIAGWVYPVVLVILLANGTSRAVYLAGAYPLLFAAGGVAVAGWVSRWQRVGPALGAVYAAVLLLSGAYIAPLALPVLGVEDYLVHAKKLGEEPSTSEKKEVGALPQFFADMHGWPELAEEVARVADQLEPGERERAMIFVGNYGQAGALRFFGRRHDLPPALSGHNAHWMWGPEIIEREGLTGDVVIVLGSNEEDLRRSFEQVTLAGRTRCTYCMPYENDVPIWIARGPHASLEEIWPELKHFD